LLKAGDRAPDIAFYDSSSSKIRTLFELLRPFQPLALVGLDSNGNPTRVDRLRRLLRTAGIDMHLVADQNANAISSTQHLIDIYGDFAWLYGMDGDFFCLVRPDDHIGLFQRPIDEGAITHYIATLSGS
jgi:hypothetical protein